MLQLIVKFILKENGNVQEILIMPTFQHMPKIIPKGKVSILQSVGNTGVFNMCWIMTPHLKAHYFMKVGFMDFILLILDIFWNSRLFFSLFYKTKMLGHHLQCRVRTPSTVILTATLERRERTLQNATETWASLQILAGLRSDPLRSGIKTPRKQWTRALAVAFWRVLSRRSSVVVRISDKRVLSRAWVFDIVYKSFYIVTADHCL